MSVTRGLGRLGSCRWRWCSCWGASLWCRGPRRPARRTICSARSRPSAPRHRHRALRRLARGGRRDHAAAHLARRGLGPAREARARPGPRGARPRVAQAELIRQKINVSKLRAQADKFETALKDTRRKIDQARKALTETRSRRRPSKRAPNEGTFAVGEVAGGALVVALALGCAAPIKPRELEAFERASRRAPRAGGSQARARPGDASSESSAPRPPRVAVERASRTPGATPSWRRSSSRRRSRSPSRTDQGEDRSSSRPSRRRPMRSWSASRTIPEREREADAPARGRRRAQGGGADSSACPSS